MTLSQEAEFALVVTAKARTEFFQQYRVVFEDADSNADSALPQQVGLYTICCSH